MKIEEKLPTFFISMLKNQYGEEKAKKIIEGYDVKRKVTLRANTLKTNRQVIKRKSNRI